MSKNKTHRFPAADVRVAKSALDAFRENLVAKAAVETATTFDVHVVFNVGKITVGPAKDLMAELVDYPMTFLLYEPPGGATYAELLDVFFGAPRAKKAKELMTMALLELHAMSRMAEDRRSPMRDKIEVCYLRPLFDMAVAYSFAKVPQVIVAISKSVF